MKKTYQKILTFTLILSLITSTILLVKQDDSMAYSGKFNMTYLYGNNSETYLKNIESTNDSLSMVSPSYFDINPDGTLNLVNVDTNFIKTLNKKGIKVMPFLSNHWDREVGRAALRNRQVLAEQIVQAIEKYNLDGINVDIENVTAEDKDEFTDLVKLLKEKLPKGKEVSVAVAANPNGYTAGWHGSYDYEKLAQYSDYLIIMAYDESYNGSPSGPVASYSFVEKSIKYLLNKGISPKKIVLGMPFYGRYWNDSDPQIQGNALQQTAAENLANKYNAKVIFDKEKKSPMIKFTITEDGPQSTIAGSKLTPGNYTVWFENNDSIKAKLELVNKYNLKGAGSWKLGQENTDLWNYYSLWLNNKYFKDIENHWAEEDIIYSIKQGWMKGISDNQFSPDGQLTRAQVATVLVRAMNLQNHEIESKDEFIDVNTNHWAYKEIQIAKDKGLVSGFEDNTFAPDKAITREEMATLISRVIESNRIDIDTTNTYMDYKDVKSDRWSYDDIMKMTSLGILKGVGDNKFNPTNKMTRAEMSALMNRLDNTISGL
ncbi:putative sporulation-specific glycosylase [Gottschalkia acidurici 9a]|uniref:Sporulation-specific glycosylase n=1 Tax=Gottschalkia acidurici (strain ATCC 7906 / DSM 604 / BCRC 14475 / CIP 104303 / KCTC 5404 / NCIMB 10678 / 9a) TaxID=1128398 RepID=K0AWZ5_GOTA9|nr:glycosyl hydrolase family 18 protein [Gottschalkia acidurici]AFS78333.1 putative sporulation-specific glycosylase [Gottschalkia acidurici 9a]